QTEYFVPRPEAVAALRAVARLSDQIAPLLQISEIRTIAADDLWLSPHYQRDSVGIHFTWKKDWPGVRHLLPKLEQALAPFQARPHWGKLFTMSGRELQSHYERLDDARRLRREFDPNGKFANAFLEGIFD
ncbi:MAG TPA: D-arabinono-1,4-lactone oxidase, partial [Tepidisphaeraceae bacterium]